MSTQIDLGPVLSVPKGDWNANTTYERLNLVRHNSASWICNVATSTGVEPTEDSTDWYLQVKDTSSVTSVNGMKGDVVIELTETETPPANDSSNRIATTEWVTDKLGDVDLSGIKDDTILAVTNATDLQAGGSDLSSAELVAFIADSMDVAKNSVPTGTVIAFAADSEPPGGYLLCNGATISRTTYTDLYAAIGTTYGAGDGSTTFALPDLTDRFIQGSGTAGTTKAAGLPNITGKTWNMFSQSDGFQGALSNPLGNNSYTYSFTSNSGTFRMRNVVLDASGANDIYGASTTVQPPAVTMRFYIKY